jgi:hypothetical protein
MVGRFLLKGFYFFNAQNPLVPKTITHPPTPPVFFADGARRPRVCRCRKFKPKNKEKLVFKCSKDKHLFESTID